MKTADVRWMRIRDLFEQAVELPVEQRDAFVEKHCGSDVSLREELKDLLASDSAQENAAQSKGILTGAIGDAVDSTTRNRREQLLGSRIGPYKLASILGHGGAGTVYLAERIDRQYSAQVAIKIVEGASLNSEIGRRFKAERQILANLNHPNIARLMDAGETEDGYPYLVMEYIHGESVDKYCDRLKLGIEDRIKLFLKVCAAVQYAHQNLVIHRDLKPGNILVTPDGTPKLLDFGIAKLLDTGQLASELALTRMNDRLLTPEYASPEQILGQNVTTGSDVYSLGVILFELLTGFRPYKITGVSQLELERTICVEDVSRASTLIRRALTSYTKEPDEGESTRDIHAIAEARQVTPMRLRARLNGDLDSILARSLRKESEHRYRSVEQLADDLRRHLAREPVLARQGNWLYLTQRFARRHALGVGVVLAFIALLSSALVMTSMQNSRIAHERDVATREKSTSEAVANFMTTVFSEANPYNNVGNEATTARELLDVATHRIRDDLGQQPELKARLLETMGLAYSGQGQPDRGVALVREALRIRKEMEGAGNPSLATTYLSLGKVLLDHYDRDDAKKAIEEAQALLRSSNAPHLDTYAETLVAMGRVTLSLGHPSQARTYFGKALTIVTKQHGHQDRKVAAILLIVAYTYVWESDFESAANYAERAVKIYSVAVPETHPERLDAESTLGEDLLSLGKVDQAAPILEQAYSGTLQVFGKESTRIIYNLNLMVDLRRAQGNLIDAEKYAREAMKISLNRLGPNYFQTGFAKTNVAIVLLLRGRYHEAEQELRSALNIYRISLPADHPYIQSAEHYLSEALLGEGRVHEALFVADKTIAELTRTDSAEWRVARSENTKGQALWLQKQYSEALPLLERSYQILSHTKGPDKDTVALARKRLEAARKTLRSKH